MEMKFLAKSQPLAKLTNCLSSPLLIFLEDLVMMISFFQIQGTFYLTNLFDN